MNDVVVKNLYLRVEFDDDTSQTFTFPSRDKIRLPGMTDEQYETVLLSDASRNQAFIDRFLMFGKDGGPSVGFQGAFPKRWSQYVGTSSDPVPEDVVWTII